ncbi:MAG: glycosyltransferase [Desulfuromonadales bacterium]
MNKLVFVLPGIKGGGAERVVLNLYKAMERFHDYECHIVSFDRDVAHELEPDLRVHYLDQKKEVSKKGVRRLTYRKKLAKLLDDFISANIGRDCIILSNMVFVDKVTSLSRLNVFHLIHSAYGQSLLGGKSTFRRFFIKRNISNVYGRHPLIFVSEGARESFLHNFKTRVDKEVIYNPLDQEELKALAEAKIEKLDFDYLVHVGRFSREKRHDRLLRAFSAIRTNVKLVLLGEGKLENRIKVLVKELGLTDRVVFMGFKQNPYPYIKISKALVLSSDFEGLPTVILEALSLGTPVVATDCPGGIREIVSSQSHSLVPVDDVGMLSAAMEDVLCSPEKYISALSTKFDSRTVSGQYHELFQRYLAGGF